ncbi:MAG: hypothetical protein WA696_10870 [Solirubrobacterales bacterium]
MADRGPITESQNGGHAASFEAELAVADRVNTAMNAVESARLGSAIDALVADPGGS